MGKVNRSGITVSRYDFKTKKWVRVSWSQVVTPGSYRVERKKRQNGSV